MEKAMSMVLLDKAKGTKPGVSCEHALKYLVDASQQKCKTALEVYTDKDGMRTDDINALAGQRSDKKPGDVWTSFYDKVKEVKDYHRRFSLNSGLPEIQNCEWFYQRAVESDRTDAMFTGEEDLGKHVDMQGIFTKFINIKKIAKHRRTRLHEQTYARMKKKIPDLEPDDPKVEETINKEFNELDYIEWLSTFDQFHEIPRYCKYKDKDYFEYLQSVTEYLKGFIKRTQPMFDIEKLEQKFDKDFEERWVDRSIPGWQEATHKSKLFSLPSNRLFNNPQVMKSHQGGKHYKKKVEEVQKMSFEDQKKLVTASEAEDKRIAQLENRAAKWRDNLGEVMTESIQHLQKRQSQTAGELELDKSDDSDDEEMLDGGVDVSDDEIKEDEDRPIYNPLKLPLGWDGKPIPFWLYKLHGLGIEYKCEICGNYSYWGRRAFERHFQEWRHAFGMRCLKIPNTAHFKEITKIEDAITLYEKLKRDAEEQTFRPDQDVECEDIQGNVMSQRAFEDLRRQGLV